MSTKHHAGETPARENDLPVVVAVVAIAADEMSAAYSIRIAVRDVLRRA